MTSQGSDASQDPPESGSSAMEVGGRYRSAIGKRAPALRPWAMTPDKCFILLLILGFIPGWLFLIYFLSSKPMV